MVAPDLIILNPLVLAVVLFIEISNPISEVSGLLVLLVIIIEGDHFDILVININQLLLSPFLSFLFFTFFVFVIFAVILNTLF